MWFRYFKQSETLNTVTENINYSYPYSRRLLKKFAPKDTLEAGMWIGVDLAGLDIGYYTNSSLQKVVDHSSYLVVYQTNNLDQATPVRCVINDDTLYFQTAENHTANTDVINDYYLYYNTPNLRYVQSVNNGPILITDGPEDPHEEGEYIPLYYQIGTSETATNHYAATINEVDDLTFEVDLDSNSSYNFSFVNSNTDWKSGETTYPGARVYLSFSGPKIELYGSKGPDFGKIKLTLTALGDEATPNNFVVEKDLIIDCFGSTYQNNTILFSRVSNELEFKDYVMDIQVLNDKNVSSKGNKFKLNSYKFDYNVYSTFSDEEFSDKIALISSGMIRGK